MDAVSVDPSRPALGIRQPWVELILRGHKTLEIRSQPTKVRGPIYVYASKTVATIPEAAAAIDRYGIAWSAGSLQRLVGTVEVVGCRRATASDAAASQVSAAMLDGMWAWELSNPIRFDEPVKPRFLPYGVWFYPFRRRHA